jgi:hypothetical protein
MNARILYKDCKEKIKATERTIKLNLKYHLPIHQKQIGIAKNSPVRKLFINLISTRSL